MDNYRLIGKILKPVGLKGFVHVNFIHQDKDCLVDEPFLFIKNSNGYQKLTIEGLRIDKPYIIKLSGIDDRTAAETHLGRELYLEELPDEIKDDEIYPEDMRGMKVFSKDVERGIAVSINNYGASDILEVRLSDGKTVLLPLIEETVKEINLKEKIIFIKNIDDYI
jgi:16S rRNA processing protein RimM